jgi:hypothetical protein
MSIAFNIKKYSDLYAIVEKDAKGTVTKRLYLHKCIVCARSQVLQNYVDDNPNQPLDFSDRQFRAALESLFKWLYTHPAALEIEDHLLPACWAALDFYHIEYATAHLLL